MSPYLLLDPLAPVICTGFPHPQHYFQHNLPPNIQPGGAGLPQTLKANRQDRSGRQLALQLWVPSLVHSHLFLLSAQAQEMLEDIWVTVWFGVAFQKISPTRRHSTLHSFAISRKYLIDCALSAFHYWEVGGEGRDVSSLHGLVFSLACLQHQFVFSSC